jgi:hypothetical protein
MKDVISNTLINSYIHNDSNEGYVFYFYHILSVFNKLKIMSEVVLLLPHTVCLQQAEDYVRGCTTSTEY